MPNVKALGSDVKMGATKFVGPIFIIGLPRSGTKLFRDLLNQHSLIGIPSAETLFLPWMVQNWVRFGDISIRTNFAKFYRDISRAQYFQYMAETGTRITENEWYDSCTTFTQSEVFEVLMRHDGCSPAGADRIWGDKSPNYIDHVSLIRQLYPEARIVCIVRDVRDVCLSANKVWHKNILRVSQRWADSMLLIEKSRHLTPDHIIGVRYEDLLDEPEHELKRVCNFLGIQYEASMCTLRKSVENFGSAQGMNTIKQDNIQKYLKKMSDKDQARIEEICWPVLEVWGYPYHYSGAVKRVPRAMLTFLKACDALNIFRFHIRERGFLNGIRLVVRLYAKSDSRL